MALRTIIQTGVYISPSDRTRFFSVVLLISSTAQLGCAPTNTLQDAVNGIRTDGVPSLGNIVKQEVRHDWAYVITESMYGYVGTGLFCKVQTRRGLVWTPHGIIALHVENDTSAINSDQHFTPRQLTLRYVGMLIGGELAMAKKEPDEMDGIYKSTWNEYIATKGYSVQLSR